MSLLRQVALLFALVTAASIVGMGVHHVVGRLATLTVAWLERSTIGAGPLTEGETLIVRFSVYGAALIVFIGSVLTLEWVLARRRKAAR